MNRASRSELDRQYRHFMAEIKRNNHHEPEFHQAVGEVAESVLPFIMEHREYARAQILERLTEPDRIIIFRVAWEDDAGCVHVNRAWRVQFNNAIGPYKGGLRFSPSVTQSVFKFLGFEQCFKNALTTLPMGGAKGGANFDPKGKSDREIMRFCQSMMVELHRHIGEDVDVPAGDIGVGPREIGYLFGMYKRLVGRFAGILTGKGLAFGGSPIRTQATGYGTVYFTQDMLNHRGEGLKDRTCVISGSGNVALYAAEKAHELGAKVIAMSDSSGVIHDPDGIDQEKLAFIKDLKEVRRGRIYEYAQKYGCEYQEGGKPWSIPCDIALPCARQNELVDEDAEMLLANGCLAVAEGANMPCTPGAADRFTHAKLLYAPGKAANAGGVAVSGMEQSQNALRISWTADEVDKRLRDIMSKIHEQCVQFGADENGRVDYVKGANIAGFNKVAEAMLAYGVM